jgi:MoaA/NifB/PqqE/SkfB family radical SAM enzyme
MRNAGHLDTLIFFVTSRCNSKCRSCFYWEELNQTNDLSFEEIERVSGSMPRFRELWLSGGEPTLRDELPEILSLFYRANGVRSVNYPANGIQPHRLIEVLERVIVYCPELRINLNLALDGFESTHDRIRGVPGNFQRAMTSLDALRDLRERTPELRVHINSVICAENIDEMLPLGELIRDRHDLDGHYFQVIRGEPMDPELLKVHENSVARLYEQLKPIYRHYASKVGKRKRGFRSRLEEIAYLGSLNLYHQIQAANLSEHHPWPMRCTAGQNIVVLDANGDIRACELRQRLGNLRRFDCDWKRFWDSKAREEEIAAIDRDGCWCTHVCFIHASLKASSKALLVDVPRAYIGQLPSPGRRGKLTPLVPEAKP